MIKNLIMGDVNCFKNSTVLETDKKVNLIYGLNGTGKSTISNYLSDPLDSNFSNCAIKGITNEEILVYNQKFIIENFYESDELNGIFTLSKANKDAELKIKTVEKLIEVQGIEKEKKSELFEQKKESLNLRKRKAENKIWEIKTNYSGGDRAFDYCFENLRNSKANLLKYFLKINKPKNKPSINIEKLEKEIKLIQNSDSKKYNKLPKIEFDAGFIESNQLFDKSIIGNESSTVAGLIKELNNPDWVKDGLEYLPSDIEKEILLCPFCQERTITEELVNKIKEYFDATYENDIKELKQLLSIYNTNIKSIPSKKYFESSLFSSEDKANFDKLYDSMINCLNNNRDRISNKIKSPSKIIEIKDSKPIIEKFNEFIENMNMEIMVYNKKIHSKEVTLNEYKQTFWFLMRWEYDQTISAYIEDKEILEKEINDLDTGLINIDKKVLAQKQIIKSEQKKTINIDEAINNINSGLIELGINDFFIEKYNDDFYKINRDGKCENTFLTLSEGEKMIISFLYFRELCKGKRTASGHLNKKIVVIDDPISSLSHIYVFNIGHMIRNDFFNSNNYKQVFLLTHSLYFFYEMTDINHERRKQTQKLFRLVKNDDGSYISTMKYEEIQNDYQSYWSIIKDDTQRPALIANCMRNIIEYFFGFIENTDLNNVFQKSALKDTRYQAFYRYINRESHSFGQNIFDIKEFDFESFKEAFRLVFKESGYESHYKKMIS